MLIIDIQRYPRISGLEKKGKGGMNLISTPQFVRDGIQQNFVENFLSIWAREIRKIMTTNIVSFR